jgi:hypothetical protein
MRRRTSLLGLSLPIAAIGSLAGHTAAYALVGGTRQDAEIHGYLSYAPQFLALCVSAVAIALVLRASGRLGGRPAAWPFAAVPPLAFVLQELIERLAAGLPVHAVFESAVYVGLAAQLPVACVAFFVARALLRLADEVGLTLAPRPAVFSRDGLVASALPVPAFVHSRLAFDRLGRAPPCRTVRSATR